jgi:kumamolisin
MPLDKTQTITVSLFLRPMTPVAPPVAGAPPMDPATFAAQHSADPADIDAIRAFANDKGLQVVGVHPIQRIVNVSGTIEQLEAAFGADTEQRPTANGEHRFLARAAQPMPHLGIVKTLGWESAPFAQPHFRRRRKHPTAAAVAVEPHAMKPLGPVKTAQMYGVTTRPAGTYRTCHGSILCLGGGYTSSDVAASCQLNGIPVPTIIDESVLGAGNAPGNDADVELMLDIVQMAGAYFARTGQHMTIHVIFCPNTDAGYVTGSGYGAHITNVATESSSWGSSEDNWAQSAGQFDSTAKGSVTLGVTYVAASGDGGATDGTGGLIVDFPAASPYVLGMGGTNLSDAGEVVWNDPQGGSGGGGISGVETPKPPWQSDYPTAGGRCVPDLAANSAPATCGTIVVQGQHMDIGGTSAAAPFMAGILCALCEELPHNIGYLNPLLETMPATCFEDIIKGDNGGFSAKPGPDMCTGRGSPKPLAMLAALKGTAPPPVIPPPVTPPPVTPPPPITPPPTDMTVAQFQANLRASARRKFTADLKTESHLERWSNAYYALFTDNLIASEPIA